MRYDYNKAYSAEQDELDENGNPTGTTFPQTDFYTWKQLSPRVGFNLKLTGGRHAPSSRATGAATTGPWRPASTRT